MRRANRTIVRSAGGGGAAGGGAGGEIRDEVVTEAGMKGADV
jgi:hypothetical protein